MIEFYAGLVILGLLSVVLSAWLVADRKKADQRRLEEQQDIRPLLGVVTPKKKDGNNE